ncbi:LuxR family transcriptional regulator [uncultured Phycicoccus sp.]|uniref:helix-turn-helix transcriptional regulator n=1 Tax=uncultured Phycicoccus sp. TaxID=661422 RepID=UPI00262419C0|nr:LuxR family transcriptional regulator [uncultured Phycicoccus sp.]
MSLVGRAEELGVLTNLVRGARDGRFGAVVLQGDAGIGKTTLVRAACETAAGEGALVLPGTCLPLTAVSVPLLGLRSAVRALPPDEQPAVLGSGGGAASRELPVPVAVDDWLTRQTSAGPVVLMVDDLQWADGETLDALLYVLAGPVERPLGVVLTVRSTDVGPSHPLRRWLADARRLPGVEERTLGPLTRDEVGEELALVLGEPAHTSLVDEVHVRSGGNPYFARLLVDGLDPSSRALPRHLPEALSAAAVRSWGVLSVDARRLVVTLAVGGRPVRGAPLARVADIADLPDPGPALHEAVDAGMLDVADDGAYWFHHPLQAEALEASLLPDQRRALHAGFAAEYAQEAGAELTAELAETVSDHYTRAGRPEEARRWALLAARAMRASGDEVGRLRMLRRCVSYGASLAGPGAAWRETLLEVRDLAEDLADWEAELEAIDALGEELAEDVEEDALTLAVLGARRAILCFITGRGETSGDLARPLALSAFRPGSWQRLYVVAEYVHILTWEGRAALAAAALAEVEALLSAAADGVPVDAGERRGEDRARAYGLAAVAMYANLSDAVSGHEAGRVAADAAAACGDGFTLLDAAFWEANSLATRSRAWLEAMEQRRRQMLELRIAHPYVAWLCASQAHTALHLGEVRLCADRLRVALGSDPGPSGDFSARLTAALLAAGQGRQREAEAHLARADELLKGGRPAPAFIYERVLATVLLSAGDDEGAVAAALDGLDPEQILPTDCEWLVPIAARGLADLVCGARDAGQDPGPYLRRIDELRARFPQVARDVGEITEFYRSELDALDAWYAAEVARARLADDAPRCWCAAVDLLAAAERPWEEAYASWRAGEALLRRGDADGRRQAAAVLRRGHGIAVRLEAAPTRGAIEALARSARISLAVVTGPDDSPPGMRLTPREREILAYVVAGRTYAEIAGALFLSEKTVSSHISNMLRKTRSANRIELAAWASRQESAL